jgi:hypothetical protein
MAKIFERMKDIFRPKADELDLMELESAGIFIY